MNIYEFQSTFPRGERHLVSAISCAASCITIHVPAWGTTNIHQLQCQEIVYFNPRSRVGNDVTYENKIMSCFFISIHVPAWGTTTDQPE